MHFKIHSCCLFIEFRKYNLKVEYFKNKLHALN